MIQFQVRKDDYSQTRIIETTESRKPGPGEILVQVERFGFSANNITYAVAGETMSYWQFFVPENDPEGEWGIIPVWGFADVVASETPEISVGERLFGYFPPASQLCMKPTGVSDQQLFDGSEHRSQLPRGYNLYRRSKPAPTGDHTGENLQMLLYPLFVTSFSLWDFLQENNWYDAEQILLVSASSKTSIGLGYALAGDPNAPKTIGVTSDGNATFVGSIGAYDGCLTYENILQELQNVPTAIVDMSGNSVFLGELHHMLGDNMRHTVNVGLTHWENFKPVEKIIRERSGFFFAPSQIQKRIKEWGAREFDERSTRFFNEAIAKSNSWLELSNLDGLTGLSEIYSNVLTGTISPKTGIIIEMP